MTYSRKNEACVLSMVCFSIVLASAFSCSYIASYGSVTYNGQVYKTVKIGTQTWMAENLNYEVEGSKCYENKPENCQKYGRLYDWATAMEICPPDWHIPSNADWDKLFHHADGTKDASSPYKSKTAGKYLKAPNAYGFLALLSGHGHPDGDFEDIGISDYWWSADEVSDSDSDAYYRIVYYYNENANWNKNDKLSFFSVRCLLN